MSSFIVNEIGKICADENGFSIKLDKTYLPSVKGLNGFSYAQILWWFDGCDNAKSRSKLTESKPYLKGPDVLGTFATRSPERPNPLALSTVYVTYVDEENGVIGLAHIDARNDTPVLDIKPYTPSLDRADAPIVPQWCAHWPDCIEKSGNFNWDDEFNF